MHKEENYEEPELPIIMTLTILMMQMGLPIMMMIQKVRRQQCMKIKTIIFTSGNFSAHMSAELPSNISHNL